MFSNHELFDIRELEFFARKYVNPLQEPEFNERKVKLEKVKINIFQPNSIEFGKPITHQKTIGVDPPRHCE